MSRFATRAATSADAAAIATICNEGIADRIATFETEPRVSAQIAEWFAAGRVAVVAETADRGVVAFGASVPYSARPCYAGIHEYSALEPTRLTAGAWFDQWLAIVKAEVPPTHGRLLP